MNCEHYFELQSTQWQYPPAMSGTAQAVEVAYLMCKKCWIVKKVNVDSQTKQDDPDSIGDELGD